MIVVDSNILAYLYLQGQYTLAAEELMRQQPEWAAPILWKSEFRNILAGYLRRGILTYTEVCALLEEAEDAMLGFEFEVSSTQVLELVNQSDCSAYDCEFVALAKRLNTPLFTMDKKILRAFPETAVPLGQ